MAFYITFWVGNFICKMLSRTKLMLRVVLIMAPVTLQVVCYQGSSFVMISEMKNNRFDLEIIFSLSARSRLDCSTTCETHGTCLSFQYSSLNGQCRLFNTIFLHQDSGVHDIGWHYYIASNSMTNINIFFLFCQV